VDFRLRKLAQSWWFSLYFGAQLNHTDPIMATTGSFAYAYSKVAVKLTGVSPNGSIEFEHHLQVGEQEVRALPPQAYKAEELIELQFAATFEAGRTIEARARVLGYSGVSLQMVEQGRGVTADISHQSQQQKACFLLCLQNGQTSSGPCLTCPDGQNFARICC
jgi:hypothetical protein